MDEINTMTKKTSQTMAKIRNTVQRTGSQSGKINKRKVSVISMVAAILTKTSVKQQKHVTNVIKLVTFQNVAGQRTDHFYR